MSHLPDLVRDSKLETRFREKYTKHRFYESDPARGERAIIREEYWMRKKPIGAGAYGRVWYEQCVRGAKDQDVRAVKQIHKPQQSGRNVDCNRELEAIAKFSHDRYVRCFVKSTGWFEDDYNLYIAMEYLPYGDLHNHVSNSGPLPELEAQAIAYQLLEGLSLLHENGFAHRDLKPSNILVKSKPPDPWWIKIGDFGISKRVEATKGDFSTMKGTLAFMPPENFGFVMKANRFEEDSSAAQAADMWSCGEVIFQLLTRQPTFKDTAALVAFVQGSQPFPISALKQNMISTACIDLLQSTMQAFPIRRMRVDQALLHPWTAVCRIPSPKAASIITLSSFEADDNFQLDGTSEHSKPSAAWSTIQSESDPQVGSIASEPARSNSFVTAPSSDQLSNLSRLTNGSLQNTDEGEVSHSLHHSIFEAHKAFEGSEVSETASPNRSKGGGNKDSGNAVLQESSLEWWQRHLQKKRQGCEVWRFRRTFDWRDTLTFSSDGRLLASVCRDQTLLLQKIGKSPYELSFEGFSNSVHSVAFAPSGNLLATSSQNEMLRLWQIDINRGTLSFRWKLHFGPKTDIKFSPNSELLAVVRGKSMWLVEVSTSESILTVGGFEGHSKAITEFVFSPDGKLLASASEDKKMRLWDVKTGCQLSNLKDGDYTKTGREFSTFINCDRIWTMAFSPDNKLLALAGSGNRVCLHEVDTGNLVLQIEKPISWVNAVAFSPDGNLVASTGCDEIVRLWDVGTGHEVLQLKGHKSDVMKLAFSPDGRLLASSGLDNTLRLWNVDNSQLPSPPSVSDTVRMRKVDTVHDAPQGKISMQVGQKSMLDRLWGRRGSGR